MRLIPIAAALLLLPTAALAHVTIWPKESSSGAREKYEVRVPNEKQADTVAIEVRFPTGLRVTSFEQKPGWMTEPLRDASSNAIGVRWTGRLAPQQFTEFGLLAVNPPSSGELSWTATQIFADGTKVEWSGAAGSKTPAPRVTIRASGSPPQER
jgi:uncharacterized protein YcnI